MDSGRCGRDRPRRSGEAAPAAELTRRLAADALAILGRQSVGARCMEIVPVPAFSDNYIWLVHDEASGETAVVDPGDAAPVLAEAERRGWTIEPDLEHPLAPRPHRRQPRDQGSDAAHASPGPAGGTIPGRDVSLDRRRRSPPRRHVGRVIEVPGHTLGHIALIFDDERVAFVGDTLFAMGCGRLFEGTPQQMYRSLQRLAEIAGRCTRSTAPTNIRSRTRVSPRMPSRSNDATAREASRRSVALARRGRRSRFRRRLREERETNPFVRASNWQEFARIARRQRQLPFMSERRSKCPGTQGLI